jgi:hypothetical protein
VGQGIEPPCKKRTRKRKKKKEKISSLKAMAKARFSRTTIPNILFSVALNLVCSVK